MPPELDTQFRLRVPLTAVHEDHKCEGLGGRRRLPALRHLFRVASYSSLRTVPRNTETSCCQMPHEIVGLKPRASLMCSIA